VICTAIKRQICIQYSSDCCCINICDFGTTPKQVIFKFGDSQIGVDEDTFLLGHDAIPVI
jgi:hypothetical protein